MGDDEFRDMIMGEDILIIINPHSGLLNPLRTGIAEIEYHAAKIIPRAEIVRTESEEHAREVVEAAINKGIKIVAAAGGDGTARFMAEVLKNTSVSLGLIPCGSAGNVATCLEIPPSPRRALKAIKKGRAVKMDIGCAGETIFLEAAGAGFHADVLKKYSRRSSKSLARSVYSLGASISEGSVFNAKITADGKTFEQEATQITVSNLPMYGTGFMVAPDAVYSDGLLELTIIKPTAAWRLPAMALAARFGLLKLDPDVIHVPRLSSITLETEPTVTIHADAEMAGSSPIEFTVLKQALNVIVP